MWSSVLCRTLIADPRQLGDRSEASSQGPTLAARHVFDDPAVRSPALTRLQAVVAVQHVTFGGSVFALRFESGPEQSIEEITGKCECYTP